MSFLHSSSALWSKESVDCVSGLCGKTYGPVFYDAIVSSGMEYGLWITEHFLGFK